MKKLLAIFASLGILTNISASVISCQPTNQAEPDDQPKSDDQPKPDNQPKPDSQPKPDDQPEKKWNVDILVEDGYADPKNPIELTTFNYQTDFETLGELMSAPENEKNYHLTDWGGDLGFFLDAITYQKDGKTITLPEHPDMFSYYWALWWIDNQGKKNYSDVGMSNFVFAEKSEEIIWRFTKIH